MRCPPRCRGRMPRCISRPAATGPPPAPPSATDTSCTATRKSRLIRYYIQSFMNKIRNTQDIRPFFIFRDLAEYKFNIHPWPDTSGCQICGIRPSTKTVNYPTYLISAPSLIKMNSVPRQSLYISIVKIECNQCMYELMVNNID